MTHWHDPTDVKAWTKGIFSPLNALIIVVIMVTMVSEWRLNWCEGLVGHYLAAVNASRPETGTVWDTGAKNSTAKSYLKTIISNQKEASRYASETASFMELASGILPGQWTHITKNHFKSLYLALPESAAFDLLPSLELVWLFGSSDVDKIFCEGKAREIDIFFLGKANRVIKQISVSRAKLSEIDQANAFFKGRLEAVPDFTGTVYSATQFFKTALALPREAMSQLVLRPGKLMYERGRMVRVGIWPETPSPYIQLGFEIQGKKGPLVMFTKGQKWAVRQFTHVATENSP